MKRRSTAKTMISVVMLIPAAVSAESVLLAETKPITLPELTVEAEAEKSKSDISLESTALPAQVEVIDKEQIESLPFAHSLDLFRRTPGIVTRALGQGAVGDDFGIRGFNGGHGVSAAVFVDGVPINISNGRAHGLSDINWLVPEIAERIEVIKGPFSALYGNFALGGVVNITTRRSDPAPTAGASIGSYDTYRAFATYSHENGGVTPFLFAEGFDRGGYRDNSDFERYSTFNNVTLPFGNGSLTLRAQALKEEFGAPSYLFVEDLQSGFRDRRDAINATDGGEVEYYNLVANYAPNGEAGLHATLYVGADDYDRFSAFPIHDRDPENPTAVQSTRGGQTFGHNERSFTGWKLFNNWTWGERAALILGTDGQYSDGKDQAFPTDANSTFDGTRTIVSTSRDLRFETLATGLFAQGQFNITEPLKLVGGLRYDRFDDEIDNRRVGFEGNSGDHVGDLVSPKVGLVYTLNPQAEFFANIGKGFRSASARELSSSSVAQGFTELDPLELDTFDLGVNLRPLPGLNLSLDYYQTNTDGELLAAAGAALVQNLGETERDGFELAADYQVSEGLRLYGSFSTVDAKLVRDAFGNPIVPPRDALGNVTGPTPDSVTSGVEDTQTLGLTWRGTLANNKRLVVDGYVQRIGEAPLNAAGSVRSDAAIRYALQAEVSKGGLSGFAQIIYSPDEFTSETAFAFGPSSFGSEANGDFVRVNALGIDPKPEIDVLVGIKYAFE